MPFSSTIRVPLWALSAALLLPGCGAPQRSPGERPAPAIAPVPSLAPRALADSATYVFNIPALVNLRANQIKATLGKPVRDQQDSINEEMKSLLYQRRGYKLSIDYEVRSGRLIDIYFTPVKSWKMYRSLLDAANVKEDDKRYKVEPLNEANGLYEGITITPADARMMDEYGHWVPTR